MPDQDFTARGGVAYVDRDLSSWESGFKTHKSATWPFARLRLGTSEIAISSLFGKLHVTRTSLVSISRFGRIPVMADGLKFVVRGHDDAVIFWAMRMNRVLDELRRRGWTLADTR